MSNLWTEKYRPKNLESFEGEAHIKQLMETSILKGFPNLLLYGPPGTGKTTFAHIISKDKLELNASDERGINVIREKIKNYASAINQNRTIILDECENLTEDAQHCLRRVIEDNKYTRFIFITNYLSKIISPLKSRLVKIKFDLKSNSVLENIGKKEGLKMDSKTYSMIFKYCNGDLRRSINILQGLHPLINNINDLEYSIEDAIGIVPSSILEKFKEITVRTYNKFIEDFIFNGYSVLQLIHQLSNFEVDNDDKNKSKFIIELSKLEELSVLGCSDEIVLNKLCICKIKIYR